MVLMMYTVVGIYNTHRWYPLKDIPDSYYRWWLRAEQCIGITKDISKVRFYITPTEVFPCSSDISTCAGAYLMNTIYLSEFYQHDSTVVIHEIIHHLDPSLEHGKIFGSCSGRLE